MVAVGATVGSAGALVALGCGVDVGVSPSSSLVEQATNTTAKKERDKRPLKSANKAASEGQGSLQRLSFEPEVIDLDSQQTSNAVINTGLRDRA